MHEAKGYKVQKEKVPMDFCRWENKTIKQKPITIKLKEENTKKIKVKESIKTLGVHTHPSLNQDNEHEHVKTKLILSIKKIIKTDIRMCKVHMHFNICMLKMCILDVEQLSLMQKNKIIEENMRITNDKKVGIG